jgi:hypothetical protein
MYLRFLIVRKNKAGLITHHYEEFGYFIRSEVEFHELSKKVYCELGNKDN